MLYSEIVDVYERLEKTASRLEMRDIVSEFLLKTPDDDMPFVILILQGMAFPRWSDKELGIANKLMIKAIADVSGASEKKISDTIRETGDTGLAAEKLLKNETGDTGLAAEKLLKNKTQSSLFTQELTVEKVYENLNKISQFSGKGTTKKKLKYIEELLSFAAPTEAKYIIRLILEELRLGVGEGIIRDAIAKAYGVDAKLIERGYSLISDFGKVAKIAKLQGNEGLRNINLETGTPMRVMLSQKVDTIEEAISDFGECAYEIKYDGFRCVSGFTPIYIKNKGIMPIKDVKVGEYALTHKGNFKKIVAKNKRTIDKNERVFKVQTWLGNEFKITEKHPVLVYSSESSENFKWKNIEDIDKKDELAFPIPNLKIKEKFPEEVVLKTHANYVKTFKLNKKFFRFLGYWIGDGYSNTHNKTWRVGVMFNEKTGEDMCNFYENIIKKTFGITKISKSPHNGAIYMYWTDKPFLKWLSKNFRHEKRGWKGKNLPWWFWNISKDNFTEFLNGWVDADGCVDSFKRTSITTKESNLAAFVQLLGLKFGIIMALKKLRINNKTYFKLILTKGKPKAARASRIKDNKLVVKIFKKEELRRKHPRGIDPRSKVYNLQVGDDESYCTTLACLHNCQIHKNNNEINLFTRRLENVTNQFPEIVKLALKNINANSAIVEGEAVAIAGGDAGRKPRPFQDMSRRIKRKYDIDEMVEKIPVEINLFDIVYLNGKSLINEKFKNRRKILEEIINPTGKFRIAEQMITENPGEAGKFYKYSLELGHEGVMVKNLDAPYQPGSRVGYMYKIKPVMETLDLVIVGATWGEGRRAHWLASFLLGARDADTGKFLEIGRMGTGFTDEQFKEMTEKLKQLVTEEVGKEVKVKPKVVVEVAYEEIQKSPTYESGYALRFPRLVRVREDKGVEDADTVERVEGLIGN